MKRSLVIGTVIIIALIIAVGIYSYSQKTQKFSSTCIQAGRLSFDESTGETKGKCCNGLTEIGDVFYDSSKTCEEIFEMVGFGSICSNCGNNICESWENRCNCPKDCPNQ